jgi:hypothetical protein
VTCIFSRKEIGETYFGPKPFTRIRREYTGPSYFLSLEQWTLFNEMDFLTIKLYF